MTNCPNCGAQIEPYENHCRYCGSYYFDFAAFDCSEKCYVKFKTNVGGQECVVTALAIPTLETVEMNTETNDICDKSGAIIHRMVARKYCDLRATFSCIEDPEKKTLFQVEMEK